MPPETFAADAEAAANELAELLKASSIRVDIGHLVKRILRGGCAVAVAAHADVLVRCRDDPRCSRQVREDIGKVIPPVVTRAAASAPLSSSAWSRLDAALDGYLDASASPASSISATGAAASAPLKPVRLFESPPGASSAELLARLQDLSTEAGALVKKVDGRSRPSTPSPRAEEFDISSPALCRVDDHDEPEHSPTPWLDSLEEAQAPARTARSGLSTLQLAAVDEADEQPAEAGPKEVTHGEYVKK